MILVRGVVVLLSTTTQELRNKPVRSPTSVQAHPFSLNGFMFTS